MTRYRSPPESLLPWPTPFEFKWLGGSSPWWRQYVYYRLNWKKPSGARLEMQWRFERQYYSGKGWTEPDTTWMNDQTGMLPIEISGKQADNYFVTPPPSPLVLQNAEGV